MLRAAAPRLLSAQSNLTALAGRVGREGGRGGAAPPGGGHVGGGAARGGAGWGLQGGPAQPGLAFLQGRRDEKKWYSPGQTGDPPRATSLPLISLSVPFQAP